MSPDKPVGNVEKDFESGRMNLTVASLSSRQYAFNIRCLEDLRLKVSATYAPLRINFKSGQGPIPHQTSHPNTKKPITIFFDSPSAKCGGGLSEFGPAHWSGAGVIWVEDLFLLAHSKQRRAAYIDFAKASPFPFRKNPRPLPKSRPSKCSESKRGGGVFFGRWHGGPPPPPPPPTRASRRTVSICSRDRKTRWQ